ncbi:MAG: class I SAM-dependent methyltransferase [Planctomycetales bacterium]|nr:class I SAM-dependent methyltransferase [Planctomycetales bacterium]
MKQEQFELTAELELAHWWCIGRRKIMRAMVERVVSPHEGRLVVDVGCCTGGTIQSLTDAYQCVGIDPSETATKLGSTRFPAVKFICGFAPSDLKELAAQADMFLMMDVLEHVPDDFQMLSEMFAAAKPGAHFLVTVPADMNLWSAHDESHHHYRRYEMVRFRRLWRDLPATELMASYYNTRLFPLIRFIRQRNRRKGVSFGENSTDLRLPSPWANSVLSRIFGGESRRLQKLLDHRKTEGYRAGVSLIALLRREEGEVEPFSRPTDVAADPFDPHTQSWRSGERLEGVASVAGDANVSN